MSIFSKISNTLKKVTSSLGNVFSGVGKSSTASVYNAIKQPTKLSTPTTTQTPAYDTRGTVYVRNPSPTPGPIATPTYDTAGTVYIRNPKYKTGPTKSGTSSGGGTTADTYGAIMNLSSTFGGASAPSTATGVTNVGSFGGTGAGLPDTKSTINDIVENKSFLSGEESINALIQKERDRQLKSLEDETSQKKTLLDQIFGQQKTREQILAEQEDRYGVDMRDYLRNKSKLQAELRSLTDEYSLVEQQMNEQINTIVGSPYGVMDFTNNRVAQIERNAAPRLNRIATMANLKTAEMAALDENWEVANKYIERAVEAAVADQKDNIERGMAYFEMYSDVFNRIDQTYKDSFLESLSLAKDKLAFDREKLLISYRESVSKSLGIQPTGGFASYDIETSLREMGAPIKAQLRNGTITEEEAFAVLRDNFTPYEVTDDAIKTYLGIGGEAPVPAEIPQRKTSKTKIGSIYSPINFAPGGMIRAATGEQQAVNSVINQITNYLFK